MKNMNRKRRIVGIVLILALVLSTAAVFAADSLTVYENNIGIEVNGVTAASAGEFYSLADGTEVPYSILYNGTTYLPMRKICELVGKEVAWDGKTRTVSIGGNVEASVTPSSAAAGSGAKTQISANLNSVNIQVDGAPVANIGDSYALADGTQVPYSLLYSGTTYLPMRKVAELTGKDVGYNADTKTAVIQDKVTVYYEENKEIVDFGAVSGEAGERAENEQAVYYFYGIENLTDADIEIFVKNIEDAGYSFVMPMSISMAGVNMLCDCYCNAEFTEMVLLGVVEYEGEAALMIAMGDVPEEEGTQAQ